jgi:stearoyl-CoA desaturase (delta-9 desaturase)
MRCAHSRFIHDHYFAIQFALYALCFIINPYLAVILLAIPMTITFHGAASIGVLTHTWGYRIAETTDKSTNNWLAAIMSGGEGWHNYHHAHPSDHRNGYRWWELDPPAWIIERFFKC